MNTRDFTCELTTPMASDAVFQVLLDVRGWWSGLFEETIEGASAQLHDVFTFRAGGGAHYSRQELIEWIPNRKMVWLVTESALSFLEKQDEWTGTKLIFTLTPIPEGTKVIFTHEGLSPARTCFDTCAPAWTQYLTQRLKPLLQAEVHIATGNV
jgi:hypothetical protein